MSAQLLQRLQGAFTHGKRLSGRRNFIWQKQEQGGGLPQTFTKPGFIRTYHQGDGLSHS
uniref:Macaca fascicularis brain cDNA clone: QflA-16977, similar to human hypothetical gene supported by AK092066 (LOC400121), mRNA, RefSeq: XM_375018.1 n=1 Tax=Macaca fascicularis TaxID=9541 RepID=I7GLT7_MACFA|nr:unnamed protein product [Macaca fascicularis]